MPTKLTKEKMGSLIDEGWTDREIADAYGITLRTFQRRRLRWGYLRGKQVKTETFTTEDTLRELKEEQGLTDAQVGEMFGVSASTVKEYRMRWGIRAYGRTAGPRKPTYEQMQTWKDEGLTDDQISELVGFSTDTVRRWRREYGIDGYIGVGMYERRYQENIDKALTLRKRGLLISEIAEIIGVAADTISNWLPPELRRPRTQIDKKSGMKMLYQWIVWYKHHNGGNSPSVMDLVSMSGLSESTVRKLIKALEQRRKIAILKPNATTVHFAVVGEQWLPPSDVRVPTSPPMWESPSRSGRTRLINAERKSRKLNGYRRWYCDCGNEATHVLLAAVRSTDARVDNYGWLPLCRDCADLAEEMHETVLPLSVHSDEKVKAQ